MLPHKSSKLLKKFLFLLVLTLSGFYIQGQDLRNGVKAGVNISSAQSHINTSSIVGIRGGYFLEIGLWKAFFIQPEFLYSAKGFEFSNLGESYKTSLNYLSIPIVAKYAFINNQNLQFFCVAGPYVGYLHSARSEGDQICESAPDFDFGGQVGIGLAIGVGPGSITLDIRSGFGFGEDIGIGMCDEPLRNSTSASNLTNQVLPSVTLGYTFGM